MDFKPASWSVTSRMSTLLPVLLRSPETVCLSSPNGAPTAVALKRLSVGSDTINSIAFSVPCCYASTIVVNTSR